LAFTIPLPKNEVLPLPPVQRRGSGDGQFAKLGGQVVGQASGVALERPIAKPGTKANGAVQTIVGDMIQHRGLQVDTRKWALLKALPKIYGDKLEVDNKHTVVEGPIDDVALAQRIAFIFNSATAKLDKEGQGPVQGAASAPTKH